MRLPTADDVIQDRAQSSIEKADALAWLNGLPEQSVDLVFASPPYMDARTYGIGAERDCLEWVEWMLAVSEAACRVSRGLVLWVVAGVSRENCYWPGCEGLAWEWWKRGRHLWRPCVWWKVDAQDGGTGIPGSGGKQWLRADWEYVLAFKNPGWLPWADNTVMGHPPVCDIVGGEMSNRHADGQRINEKVFGPDYDPWKTKGRGGSGCGGRRKNGEKMAGPTRRKGGEYKKVARQDRDEVYTMPKVVNPGNVLPNLTDGLIAKARVGGGHIGSNLAHEGEAPFPERLAEFFIRSFASEGGIVADCFSGSGTTGAVALRWGRRFIGCDLRQSQVDLTTRRLKGEDNLFANLEDRSDA